jgi:auxin efflux carrier family
MITGGDLYNVLSAVVPLYVAMMLAYGSVKWWGILTPQQCMGVNRFVSIFAVPLLSFQFISGNDPYAMNFRFIAADAVSKVALLLALALWVRYAKSGSLDWMITIFMLGTIPNTLVMGTPLLAAMYGAGPGSLTVQAVVLQCIIWYTLLLVMYEYRAARILIMEQFPDTAGSIASFKVDSDVISLDGTREPVLTETAFGDDGKLHVTVRRSVSVRSPTTSMQSGTQVHSSRSMGVLTPSSKALTPRPSNLTGAEIYSLHSSRNPTPRDSNFNHNEEFYSMMLMTSGKSPTRRQSNFTSSDVYSLQSSRAPTPRTSNFNEESFKEVVHTYPKGTTMINNSPRFAPPLYRGGGGAVATGGRMHGRGGGHEPAGSGAAYGAGAAAAAVLGPPHAASNGVGDAAGTTTVAFAAAPPAMDSRASPRRLTDPRVRGDQDAAKELHMFVWSASASPVAADGGGLHVFGGNSPLRHHDFDPKEVRLLVHPQSDNASDAAGAGLPDPRSAQAYDDYSREDFSFGNRHNFKVEDIDKSGPRFDKFGSTSTTELRPKLPEDEDEENKKDMPPTIVMVKLISVMTFRKLIRNPNTYSSIVGVVWSLLAFRWHFQMPLILHNSVHILSDAGLGMAMFSLGLFMGLQERILVCGTYWTIVGMGLRFLLGPALFAAASLLVGLRGVSLHVSIVQVLQTHYPTSLVARSIY